MDVEDSDGSSSSIELVNEKKKQYVRKKYFCGSCDYVSDKPERLARHQQRHIIKSEHQCPLCTFSVPDLRIINQHLQLVHKKGYGEIQKIAELVKATALFEEGQQVNPKDPTINENGKGQTGPTPKVILLDEEEPSAVKRIKTSVRPPCDDTETKQNDEVAVKPQAAQEENVEVDQGEMMRSTNQTRLGKPALVRSGGPLVCRQVYLCPELDCAFWAQSVRFLHDHLVAVHGTSPAFKCSACPFTGKQRYTIGNHIYNLRKTGDQSHILPARVICTIPVPDHRYNPCLRFLAVPSDLSKGTLVDQGDDEKEKEVESLEAAIAEGFRKLKDVASETNAKLKHLEDEEGFVASTKALLLSEKEELNRKVDKLMYRKNKAEMALKMEPANNLSIQVLTEELEGINQELETTKEELDNLTDRLEQGTAWKTEITRQMSDARKELGDLEEEQRSRIVAYKEKKFQSNQLRMQIIGFSMQAELNRKEVDWLAQLDQ